MSDDLKNFLDEIASKDLPVIIVPHELSDPDSLASSLALKKVFEAKGVEAKVLAPQITRESRELFENIGISLDEVVEKSVDYDEYVVLLVDFTDPRRLSEELRRVVEGAREIYAIDHHGVRAPAGVKAFIKSSPSLSEILAYAFSEQLDKKLACALILGILADTSMLTRATEFTFSTLAKLNSLCRYEEVARVLKSRRRHIDERIARLKGAKRAKMIRVGDYIVAVTEIGSHESSVASGLVQLGADVALVISKHKDQRGKFFRISGRTAIKELNLSSLFSKLAEELGGVGGGHRNAATLSVDVEKVKKEELEKAVVEKIMEALLAIEKPKNSTSV